MKSPFVVNVSTILGRPGASLDVETSDVLEHLETSGGRVNAETPVNFVGYIETIDGGLVAEARVTTSWTGECRRCLGRAEGQIDIPVRELFEKKSTEGETYKIDGDQVDLEPLVREVVMLEIPVAPLCRPDCAGLCSVCGVNRNEVDCGHTLEIKDDRWAALDQLKYQ